MQTHARHFDGVCCQTGNEIATEGLHFGHSQYISVSECSPGREWMQFKTISAVTTEQVPCLSTLAVCVCTNALHSPQLEM